MKTFKVEVIKSPDQLEKAVKFIHENKFSLKTTKNKISKMNDGKIVGLLILDNEKIVGNIFYYYQPDIKINNKNYKVINFATIYILEEYRGQGIARLMIENTIDIFKNYVITDYTPVGPIKFLLKKLKFGFMKNFRYAVIPSPFKFKKGYLNKINFSDQRDLVRKLDSYRNYEIDFWEYTTKNNKIRFGTIERFHIRKIFNFDIKLKSTRVLWTENDNQIKNELNYIAFLFYKINKSHFITIDLNDKHNGLMIFSLENQFMMYPDINIKIDTLGSEFFANNL